MNTRKLFKNRKGINTILASLLMVVIVVVAAVMVYAWSTGLLGTLLVNPNNNKEGPLSADSYAWPSTTSVSINIRNAGSGNVTLNAYYITDSSGNTWQNLAMTPVTIPPNTATSGTQLSINCGSNCQLTGSGFATFTSGYSYTVKVVTTKNNPFTFTVTR
jgi:flagellin-like protein